MLSERLKEKSLFSDEQEKKEQDRQAARRFLNSSVRSLIASMKCVEEDGVMTREEIENFIIKRMEYYEVNVYPLDNESFAKWLDDQFIRDITRIFK